MLRVIFIFVLFCFSCQTGRIPCPKFKTKSGHNKRYRAYSSVLTAKAESKEESRAKKMADNRYVQNVSVEDWDCPQPGSKKYLPRTIKENIRRNARKMGDDPGQAPADSIIVE